MERTLEEAYQLIEELTGTVIDVRVENKVLASLVIELQNKVANLNHEVEDIKQQLSTVVQNTSNY